MKGTILKIGNEVTMVGEPHQIIEIVITIVCKKMLVNRTRVMLKKRTKGYRYDIGGYGEARTLIYGLLSHYLGREYVHDVFGMKHKIIAIRESKYRNLISTNDRANAIAKDVDNAITNEVAESIESLKQLAS